MTPTLSRMGALAAVVVSMGILACGNDGSTSSDRFATGLPKAQPLDELSRDQSRTLCNSLTAYVFDRNGAAEKLCYLAGIARLLQSDVFGGHGASRYLDLTCNESTFAGPCPATVAELEACVSDVGAALAQVLGPRADCPDGFALGEEIPRIPESVSCQSVDAKCPLGR